MALKSKTSKPGRKILILSDRRETSFIPFEIHDFEKKTKKLDFENYLKLPIKVNVRALLIISNGLDDELEKLPVQCAIINTSLGLE